MLTYGLRRCNAVGSFGQVAQLVEQRTENPRVGGSIPSLATTFFSETFHPRRLLFIPKAMRLLASLLLAATLFAESKADGDWTWKMASPFGELKAKATMKSDGGKLSGAFWLDDSRKLEIEDGTVEGDTVKFTLKRSRPNGGTMTYKMTGKVEGDKIQGSAQALEMGATQSWSAERAAK